MSTIGDSAINGDKMCPLGYTAAESVSENVTVGQMEGTRSQEAQSVLVDGMQTQEFNHLMTMKVQID